MGWVVLASPLLLQSAVVLEPRILDLGKLVQGDSYQAEFSIHNRSDEFALIQKVEMGCGCIKASPATHVIPPGDSIKLPLVIVPVRPLPSIDYDVSVRTSQGTARGEIIAQLIRPVRLFPSTLSARFNAADGFKTRVMIHTASLDSRSVRPYLLEVNPERARSWAAVRPHSDPVKPDQFVLDINIPPQGVSFPGQRSVMILLGDRNSHGGAKFRLNYWHRGPLKFEPEAVKLGLIGFEKQSDAEVRIRLGRGSKGTLKVVRITPPRGLAVQLTAMDAAGKWVLRVRSNPAFLDRGEVGEAFVDLALDGLGGGVWRVPVTFARMKEQPPCCGGIETKKTNEPKEGQHETKQNENKWPDHGSSSS